MSRDLTAAMQSAIQAGTVYPVIFYEGEFDSGTTRLWSGVGVTTWNGVTWQGAGELGSISAVEETTEVTARGITCTLSGIPSSLISLALGDARQGLPGKLWLGLMAASGALLADPYLFFSGRLDVPVIDEGADTSSISISYESELIDLEVARERRYSSEDQKAIYATDEGFDFVETLQDAQVVWR